MIDRQLGGYRIESEIGRGGMGVVYLAEQLRLERKVALKVISPELAHDAGFRTRFEDESRTAASIDHPNVVPIYEAGEADGLLYLAMRHVPGTDLKAALANGPLDPRRATAIIAQIGGALDAAHARGLVHRDVKPGNILLEQTPGGERAYLSDFGLTKRLSSTSGVTKTGFVVGTLDYIAPEQVQGAAVDARTDVYALACVLFHALTGRVPFERDNDMAKMYAHANLDAPSLLEVAPPGTPHELDGVIRRGMAKDPAARYASAGDLGRAAEAAARGEAPTVAERSVAVGAAAPGGSTVVDPAPPGAAAALGPAAEAPPPPRDPPTGPTQPLPPTQPPPPAPPRAMPPPPAPAAHRPPPPPAGPPPRERSQTPLLIGAGLLAAVIGVAIALLATGTLGGGDGDDEPATSEARTETVTERRTTTDTRTDDTGETTPPDDGPSDFTYEQLTSEAGGFSTVVPSGDGWSEPEVSELSGGAILRTRLAGPDGLEIIIDHTPGEAATFKPANRCKEARHPNVPYAARCEFTGGSLEPCRRSRCIDWLLNAGVDGPGWGVVVGGGDFADVRAISERVVGEFTPQGVGGP